jgi:hypothetical protein
MRIYLAGLYRAENIVAQEANIRRGRQAAAELIAAGHEVECPWLDRELIQVDEEGVLSVDDLQRNTLSKLEHWAEAICLLEGWEDSVGTYVELCAAAHLGLSVWRFHTVPASVQVDYRYVVEKYAAAGGKIRANYLETAIAERQEKE